MAASMLNSDPVSSVTPSCFPKVQPGATAPRCRAPIDWPQPEAMVNPAVIDQMNGFPCGLKSLVPVDSNPKPDKQI